MQQSMSDMSMDTSSSDMLVNNLVYKQPKALSLAVSRCYKTNFFQRSTYEGSRSETAVCDWNTGSSSVEQSNSYLLFDVALTGTTPTANWGSGSACNAISEIRIRSRSGTELERLQSTNLWSKYNSIYTRGSDNLKHIGSAEGFGPTQDGTADSATLSATATRFAIPLSSLSPFFKPMKGQLLPPQLASGLHIEIVFEDFRTALFQKGGTVTGYSISNIAFKLDTVDLTDETQRAINMESASNGLEYAFERVHQTIAQQQVAQTSLSLQVRKAVSQSALATAIVISAADKIDVTKDSLVSVPWNVSMFQWRLGSLYFPNEQLLDAGLHGVEGFLTAQQTYDKMGHPHAENSISVSNFKAKNGIMSASMEKNQKLNLSGLPINNSRVLELNCEFSAVAEQLEVVCFLQFATVAKAFTDNVATAL
jgi:hypothetical protein